MSYYNDVSIGMGKNDGVKFMNDFAMSIPDSGLLERGFRLNQYPDYLVFSWTNVKWHDSYQDVSWIMHFLRMLEEEGKPVAFVRVGEDRSDNEEWYLNEGYEILDKCFCLNRSINFYPCVA